MFSKMVMVGLPNLGLECRIVKGICKLDIFSIFDHNNNNNNLIAITYMLELDDDQFPNLLPLMFILQQKKLETN